ncbi:MAG: hypothetical protein IPO04_17590 [Cytophagaceae bacterium]|nr:hypothetical protein [Cytophagaceae bacterium]
MQKYKAATGSFHIFMTSQECFLFVINRQLTNVFGTEINIFSLKDSHHPSKHQLSLFLLPPDRGTTLQSKALAFVLPVHSQRSALNVNHNA